MASAARFLSAASIGLLAPFGARAGFAAPQSAVRPQPGSADLPEVILGVTNGVLAVVGVIALAYLAYGGYAVVTATRDPEKTDAAKTILTNAAVAIVVLALAAAIVNFVVRGVGGAVPTGVI